jgi:hypothetical protein
MSQVSIFSKGSVFDFFGQPAFPANPPVGQARMFYDSGNDTFHVIDSNGADLIAGGGGAPAFSAVTAGTNTTALVIGTGGSLTTSGTGTIAATSSPWAGLTGTLSNGQVIPYADAGISRTAANSLAIGNGTAGDFTGLLKAHIFVLDASNAASALQFGNGNTIIGANSGYLRQVNGGTGSGFSLDLNGNSLVGTIVGFAANTLTAADGGISRLAANSLAIGNGTAGDFTGLLKLGNITLTSAAPTVAAAQIGLGSTTATTASTGANGAVPAQVVGYIVINVAGTTMKVPYYAA